MATRRAFLATAAAWWSQAVEAAHQHTAASSTRTPYKFRFFQPKQVTTLQAIAGVIIPADKRSGGAAAARVEEYIDFILFHGAPALKTSWSKGLVAYSGKSADEVTTLLADASVGEFAPVTEKQKFFVLVKSAVVEAFYTSEEGIDKELSYQGMKFLLNFEGCTHASHNVPESYRPLVGKETA